MILTVDLRSEPDPTLRDGTGVPKLTSLHIMHTFYRIRYSEIVLVLYTICFQYHWILPRKKIVSVSKALLNFSGGPLKHFQGWVVLKNAF